MSKWKVFQSLSGWWACPANSLGPMDDKSEHFPTHAEALAYADRAARTVEVTLPRVGGGVVEIPAANGHPSDYRLYPRGVDGYYSAAQLHGAWGGMGIFHDDDVEPIALTLLALARRNEQA